MTNTTALDLDRAAFEAWAELADHQKKGAQHDLTGWYYFDEATQDRWEAWQAALARRSLPVDASGIKTWQERTAVQEMNGSTTFNAMKAEIADLRAALTAKGQQEPVAWMNPDEPAASDAFLWTRPNYASGHSVPVYRAAPVAQQSEAYYEGKSVDWLKGRAEGERQGRAALENHNEQMANNRHYRERVFNEILEFDSKEGISRFVRVSEAGASTAAAEANYVPGSWFEAAAKEHGYAAQPTSGRESAAPAAPADLTAFDSVVEANRKLLLERSHVGMKKYGTTLAAAGLSRAQLAQHALEEALDLANYLQTIIQTEEAQHG